MSTSIQSLLALSQAVAGEVSDNKEDMDSRESGESPPCPRYSDDEAEEYVFGRLRGQALDEFEEHLLLCETCRERVAEMDAFLVDLRAAASMLSNSSEEQGLAFEKSGERKALFPRSSIPGLGLFH